MRTATFSKLFTVVGGTFLYAGNPALAKRDKKNNLRALADDVDQSMPMEAVDPASSGGTAETEVSEWFGYSSLLLGHASTTEILEHLEADGRDVKGVCEELFPPPPLCDCSLTNLEPLQAQTGYDWGTVSDVDSCPVGTVGWNYDVCLQTSKGDVEKTRGTITLSPPTTDCPDVQEKIVCKIDKFRMTPSFPGHWGSPANAAYFMAAGTVYYDEDITDGGSGETHSCAVIFGYDGTVQAMHFVLQPAGQDLDNDWVYTQTFPPGNDRFRQFHTLNAEDEKLTADMYADLAHCGLYVPPT